MTIHEPTLDAGLHANMRRFSQQIRAQHATPLTDSLALDPLYIPGLIIPVQTSGADGGVNQSMLDSHASGLLVLVEAYNNMRVGDWIEVFWGDSGSSVASDTVLAEHLNKPFAMFINAARIPEGVHPLHYSVTRSGSGNTEPSVALQVLVRTELPGGTDPEPDAPGHQNLPPPVPELPASGIIDEEAARQGVKVTIGAYPNMREYDRITLSWGGEFVHREVAPGEAGQAIEITVPEAVILAAGDSDELVLVYRVMDEVHNQSSDWSPRSYVIVEVDDSRVDAPLIVNPDDNADPYDVIDLDVLGDSNLFIDVMIVRNGAIVDGDSVTLTWVGTTSQGQAITFVSPAQSVLRVPSVMSFEVPNADVRGLGQGRGVASYTVARDDGSQLGSKRAFASFIGVEQRLPKPTVTEATGGSLDPDLAQATVVVPGDALEPGDMVVLTWLGTQASGSPLLHTVQRTISDSAAGKPVTVAVLATYIKPLEGGRLELYYELYKAGLDTPLMSEREHLQVGQMQSELPAPGVTPPASDGWLDPDTLPNGVEVVIAPYPNMAAGQTVYLHWNASVGPDFTDSIPINSFSVNKPVPFPIVLEQLQQNVGGEVEVWYAVEEPGQPTRRSASLHLNIGKEQEEDAPLGAPVVLEALEGVLDPVQAPEGATVRVSYPGMLPGDVLAVSWVGVGTEGSYESPQQQGSAAGYVDFIVPPAVVRASEGHAVQVLFARVRNGVPMLSPPLNLVVQEVPIEGLPRPVIPQVSDGLLDLHDFSGDAQITVTPWPGIATGQRYWLRVFGVDKAGTPHTIELALGDAVTSEQAASGLDVFLPRSELLLLRNYSELRVELKVALNGSDNEQAASRFPLLIVSVRTEHQVIVESFKEYGYIHISYGHPLSMPTMDISVLQPEGHVVLTGTYVQTAYRSRFDLAFQCRCVIIKAVNKGPTPYQQQGFIFFTAQGVEVGRVSGSPGPGQWINLEFKAPPGTYVSRIESAYSEQSRYNFFESMTFEL